MNEEAEIERLRESYKELKEKREGWDFYFPREFKLPIIWTLFFAILGIIVQSISNGQIIFAQFFGDNYISWFNSFGNFSEIYQVSGVNELVKQIVSEIYYFFFTGGLLSLLWAVIYWVFHMHARRKRDEFRAGNI